MTKANYFYVNRSLMDSDMWLSEPFTRAQAWIDLIGLARHTAGYTRIKGVRIDLQRGQLCWAKLTLSKRWKWSRGKVDRFLAELQADGMVEQHTSTKTTIIHVVNYDLYQSGGTTVGATVEAENSTTDGQQTGNRRATGAHKEEGKEGKEVKEGIKKDKNYPPNPNAESEFDSDWDSAAVPSQIDTPEIRQLFRQWRETRQIDGRKIGMSVIELKGLTDEMFRAALTPYDAVDCLRACANNGWKNFNVNAWRRQAGKSESSVSRHASVGAASLAEGKL